MQKAILFDLDGTLVDSIGDFFSAAHQLFHAHALLPPDFNAIRDRISLGTKHIIQEYFSVTPNSEDFSRLSAQFFEYYLATDFTESNLFPGILDLLNILENNNILWGVVTNKKFALAIPLLEKLNIKHRAACIVGGDTTKWCKPAKEPLLYACNIINVKPENCLYVGDAITDVIAGNAAGMQTVVAKFGYIPEHVDPLSWPAHHHVDTPYDLINLAIAWQKQNL